MRPLSKLQVFANFLPKKCYKPLSPPVLSRFISARLFSVPKLKIKLKGLRFVDVAEIQEAVTDKLKKAKKRGIFSSFSETVRPHKSLYICQWSLF